MAKADKQSSTSAGSQPETTAPALPPEVKHVKMKRNAEQFPDGPTEALVHPDEVSNYALGGWVPAE